MSAGWRCGLCVSVTVELWYAAEVLHTADWVALTQIPAHAWQSVQSRLSCCSLPSGGSRQTAHVSQTASRGGGGGRRMKVQQGHSLIVCGRLARSCTGLTLQTDHCLLCWPAVVCLYSTDISRPTNYFVNDYLLIVFSVNKSFCLQNLSKWSSDIQKPMIFI